MDTHPHHLKAFQVSTQWSPPLKNMISKRVFQVCRAPGKTPCDLDKHWKPFVSRSFGPEQSDHKSYKRSWLRCFDQLIILQVRLLYNPLHCDRQGWNFQRWFEVGLKDKVRKQVQVKETSTIIFKMLECEKEHAYMQYQEEHVSGHVFTIIIRCFSRYSC